MVCSSILIHREIYEKTLVKLIMFFLFLAKSVRILRNEVTRVRILENEVKRIVSYETKLVVFLVNQAINEGLRLFFVVVRCHNFIFYETKFFKFRFL
jgi:hypothetical protein